MKRFSAVVVFSMLFPACSTCLWADNDSGLRQQVKDTEKAFAKTMADRDFDAFKSFLAEETIFFAGESPLEGKQAVVDAWAGFYEGEEAPFSWDPMTVAVLESGTLGLSSGPVFNTAGERVGTFNSIWRRGDDGDWKIVFDKGGQYCPPPEPDVED